MKSNILNQPLFRLIVPSFYGLMMYILILLINNSLGSLNETIFTSELLLCVILAYAISEPIRLLIGVFERRFGDSLRQFGAILTMIGTNALVGGAIVFTLGYLYFTQVEEASYFSLFQTTLIKLTIVYGLSAVFYTVFFLSVYFLSIKNESELKKEDLKRQNLEHQLEIFNNQINPDLLFQSLETLISLVHHDLDQAEGFVDRLAHFYRSILDNRKKELIPLTDELRACDNLMHLFKARFPEQLDLKVLPSQKSNGTMVVPGAIAMTLDCIINGSIVSQYQPMTITLDCDGEEDYLVLMHKENERLSKSPYIKHCRKNLHEAYAYFTEKPVIEIKAFGEAFVKIPQIRLTDQI